MRGFIRRNLAPVRREVRVHQRTCITSSAICAVRPMTCSIRCITCIRQYNLSGFVYNLRSFAHNLRNQDRNLRTPILKRAFLEPNNDSAIGGFPSIWRAATSAGKARYQTPVRRFAFKLRRFAPQSRRFALRLRRFTYQPRKFTPLPTCSHRSAVRQLRSRCPLLRGFVLFRRFAASLTLPSSGRGLPHVAPPLSSFVHAVSPALSPAASLSLTHHSATQSCRPFPLFHTSTAWHR